MRIEEFKEWLTEIYPETPSTVSNRISNCKKVENYHGDLDKHYEQNGCKTLIDKLSYSVIDEREENPAKHLVPIKGNLRTGSATYKQSVKLYKLFCKDIQVNVVEDVNWDVLKRTLETVGLSTFVKFYYEFKTDSLTELKQKFRKDKSWNKVSDNPKASGGKKVFELGYQIEALKYIIFSRAKKDTIEEARVIFGREYPGQELEAIRFIRPEFVFGEEIVFNLFENYKIHSQYTVGSYIVDWYIPELNIVIEFDEKHHKRNEVEDQERQKVIEKALKCSFLRYTQK